MAEKGLPVQGAKALLDAWSNDNETLLKKGKKDREKAERDEDRQLRKIFKGK